MNKEVRDITNKYLGYCFNDSHFEADDNFWNIYETEKSEQLKSLFGDKLIIEKEVEFNKPNKYILDDLYKCGLETMIEEGVDPEWREILDAYPYSFYSEYQSQGLDEKVVETAIGLRNMFIARALAENTILEDKELISGKGKSVKIKKGGKITRALKNFISDKELLNEIQVKYSQIVNTKKLKGTLCLSIHPLDYLTVSVNSSGWTSCFNTIDRGEYCASTLCLTSSPNTMVAYLKGHEDMEIGRDIVWNNKRWRALVTIGKDCESVHVGRNYPYNSEDLIVAVTDMVGELAQKKYAQVEFESNKIKIYTPYNMYNDAAHDHYTVAVTDKWFENNELDTQEEIQISPEGAICPKCGDPYDYNEFDICCDNCYDGDRCCYCDSPLPNDCGTYVPSMDGYVCDCCIDDHFGYCDHCEEYYPYEDIETVTLEVKEKQRKLGYFGSSTHYSENWCCNCIDNGIDDGLITRCDRCGEVTEVTLLDDNGLCLYCNMVSK